MLLANSTTGIF